MQKADDKKDGHPPVEDAEPPVGTSELDAEPDSEKNGKKGIELSVHEERLHSARHLVGSRPGGRVGESPQGELREVRKDDSEDGEPT